MLKSDALIESKALRQSFIDRSDVLDKIKKLSLLPDDIHATVEMTANYYEVHQDAIEKVIRTNREELKTDGLEVLQGERLSAYKAETGFSTRAASLTIIPRRAILRIGMLLQESIVSQAVRDYLLDSEGNPFIGASPEVRAILMLDQRTQAFEVRIEKLENNTTIDYGQQNDLQTIANKRIVGILGGKETPAYLDKSVRSETFSSLWHDYKAYLNINSYKNMLVKDFDKAKEYISRWSPQGKVLRDIEAANKQMSLY